jgi:hypothetical protein
MRGKELNLLILAETLAICRLEKDAAVPDWAMTGSFVSTTRTAEELSIVCPQIQVPAGAKREGGWRCIKVRGPLDFSLTGILASLTTPLAKAGISVFAISTYDTDYLLVKEENLEKAIEILVKKGHRVKKNSSE